MTNELRKVKIYAVSIMAFSPIINTDTKTEDTFAEHLPAIIPAHSINDAAERAKIFALDRWKQSEGWTGHQAAIEPATRKFFELYSNALDTGALGEDRSEQGQIFEF